MCIIYRRIHKVCCDIKIRNIYFRIKISNMQENEKILGTVISSFYVYFIAPFEKYFKYLYVYILFTKICDDIFHFQLH